MPRDAYLVLRRGPEELRESWRLHHADIREYLDRPYEARLGIATEQPGPSTETLLGARVELTIADRDGVDPSEFRLTGVITQAHYERTFRGHAYHRVHVGPAVGLLSLAAQTRLFCDIPPLQLVDAIVAEANQRFGGSLSTAALTGVVEARDYTAQRGDTDLELLLRTLADEGIFWRFGHDGAEEVLHLHDDTAALTDPEHDLALVFDPSGQDAEPSLSRLTRGLSMQAQSHCIRAWDWKSAKPAVVHTTRHDGQDNANPDANFGRVQRTDPERHREADGGSGAHLDRTARLAELGVRRQRCRGHQVHGIGTAMGLRAGVAFTVHNHPNPAFDETLYATSVVHMFDQTQASEGSAAGLDYSNQFDALPTSVIFCPQARPAPRVAGPETAVVVGDPKAPDCTDTFGRVRVRFAWAAEAPSCPIRVSQAWAGPGYGAFFVPRPGMEVVVSYLDGNAERPLVTGCVHNAANATPYPLPEDRARSTIRTCGYPDGRGSNELRFDDTQHREQVALRAQRRLDVCVRGSMYESTRGNREIRVGNDDGGSLHTWVRHDLNTCVDQMHYEEVSLDEHRVVHGQTFVVQEAPEQRSYGGSFTVDAQCLVHEASETISHRARSVLTEGTNNVDVRGAYVTIEAMNRLCLRSGDNFIEIDPNGIVIQGNQTAINPGPGVKPSSAAVKVPPIDTFETLLPRQARGASCGPRAGKGSGGGGPAPRRRLTSFGHNAPPYPPPPKKKKKRKKKDDDDTPVPVPTTECVVHRLTLGCEHGRRNEGVLEVVADHVNDRVEITADHEGPCALPLRWSIDNHEVEVAGYEHALDVVPPAMTRKLWPPPTSHTELADRTLIVVEPQSGHGAFAELWSFPNQRVDIDRRIPVEAINRGAREFLDGLVDGFDMAAFVKDLWEMVPVRPSLQTARARVYLGYHEFRDHRAYFHYDIILQLEGTLDLEVAIKAGRIIKVINRVMKFAKFKHADRVLKALKDVDFEPKAYLRVNPLFDMQWHRHSPDAMRLVKPDDGSKISNTIRMGVKFSVQLPAPGPLDGTLKINFDLAFIFQVTLRPELTDEGPSGDGSLLLKSLQLEAELQTPLFKRKLEPTNLLDTFFDEGQRTFTFPFDFNRFYGDIFN